VATAGDVNGDGFSDVIVGAYQYENGEINEGRVFVYHGSADGLATTADWTAESNQAGAFFGRSVATAGDANGDGFSDVIVGAYQYDNGQGDEGRAFVYHGSAVGLSTTAAWTAESNQGSAWFGWSVETAGDVNGDGFSDVIVGVTGYDNDQMNEGRASVYHGSAAGFSPTADWTAESNQTGATSGISVGTAGDVNGDGFSDVIVGVYHYDNGESDEGRAFVYYGNEGDGLDRIARQARTDDSAPIALLGKSDSESAFRLKALGRTPAGRGDVRFQLEVKPAGTPFDGTGLTMGPAIDTGTPSGDGSVVPLTALASGLAPETLYHWRCRIVTDSPFFPRSPWLWLPYNASSEADVRTGGPTTAVVDGSDSSAPGIRLSAAAPNPFTSTTRFTYTLSNGGRHRLAVYDVQGREVTVLAEGIRNAGRHALLWDGCDSRGAEVASGVYFLSLESAGNVEVQKVVIAR
jgi:hypothetical protein